jgi:Domain of unknown function (DUF4375)
VDWYSAGLHYFKQARSEHDRFSSLPAEWQRELVALTLLDQQMNNGAYLQFLANCGRTAYVYSRQALKNIGAHRMVEIVDTCQALVDEHFPTEGRPQHERSRLLVNQVLDCQGHTTKEAGSVLPDTVVARVYELSYEYMSYPDDVSELAQRYFGPLIEGCKSS